MKTLKWSLWVVLVIGLGVSTVMLRTRSPRPLAAESESIQPLAQDEAVFFPASPPVAVAVRGRALTVPLTQDRTDVSAAADIPTESADVVQVRADQVLATVNDRAILLKDLVPLLPDEQEQAMTSEEYQSRLDRAIEMELTFQAAAAQEVDLTPDQEKRVKGVAQRNEATFQEYEKQGATWSSVTLLQLEFEQRLTVALLLQQNLVAMEAHVAPASDPGVQARYEQARSELLSQLNARGNIRVTTAEL